MTLDCGLVLWQWYQFGAGISLGSDYKCSRVSAVTFFLFMNPSDCGKENLFFRKSVSWISSVLCFLPRFALRFIRPDPRSRVTDPVGDIISFIHMFEEKYGRTHPVFYQGTYSQVSVMCWCIDPGEVERGDVATWYQGLHGKIAFHLQAQRLSPNSLNRVMES